MSYRLSYTDEARRGLRSLPGRYRQRARRLVEGLASNPRPADAQELRDMPGVYRAWLNGWRVIWQVDDAGGAVLVVAVRAKTGPETYQTLDLG